LANLSRSVESCVFGKCTAEVRFRIDEETEELLIKKSRDAGFSTVSEYMRMITLINVRGLDTVQRLQQERLNIIAGIGS